MPLAHEAGGTEFHPGGKHWESQSDPEWKALAAWVSAPNRAEPGRPVDALAQSSAAVPLLPARPLHRVRRAEGRVQLALRRVRGRRRSTSSCARSASCRSSSRGALDFQLVKQTVEWKAPARFDQVLELSIAAIAPRDHLVHVGTTFRIAGDERVDRHGGNRLRPGRRADADEAPAARFAAGGAAGGRGRTGHRPRRFSLKSRFPLWKRRFLL